jgi:hypothetical protein
MSKVEFFIKNGNRVPLVKPKFVCAESDWDFFTSTFPEPGVRSYFLGHLVQEIVTNLKLNNVRNVFSRSNFKPASDLPGYLSHIDDSLAKLHGNVGGGTASLGNENPCSLGESASVFSLASRKNEKAEGHEKTKAGLESVRYMKIAELVTDFVSNNPLDDAHSYYADLRDLSNQQLNIKYNEVFGNLPSSSSR